MKQIFVILVYDGWQIPCQINTRPTRDNAMSDVDLIGTQEIIVLLVIYDTLGLTKNERM